MSSPKQNKPKQMARELSRMGRKGDTQLAHITPRESFLLKKMGGSGTKNPKTGLPEYFGGGDGPGAAGDDLARERRQTSTQTQSSSPLAKEPLLQGKKNAFEMLQGMGFTGGQGFVPPNLQAIQQATGQQQANALSQMAPVINLIIPNIGGGNQASSTGGTDPAVKSYGGIPGGANEPARVNTPEKNAQSQQKALNSPGKPEDIMSMIANQLGMKEGMDVGKFIMSLFGM